MRKIGVLTDAWKGSLSAGEACNLIGDACHSLLPQAELVFIPIADGGEGTARCFLSLPGSYSVRARAQDPFGAPLTASYTVLPEGTAVIECAVCAGLPIVQGRENPMQTSTYGVGLLVLDAIRRGCENILLGLGGSCTNDGGAGLVSALGVRFLNTANQPFVPAGGTLCDIAAIDCTGLSDTVRNISFTAMCDVTNPLYGPEGAARVFAPQKGALPEQILLLEDGLRHYARILKTQLSADVSSLPGGGAAGGLGAGLSAFLRAELRSGIEAVLDISRAEKRLDGCDLLITGEGCLDSQSLKGKAVSGVCALGRALRIPTVALAGSLRLSQTQIHSIGLSMALGINPPGEPLEDSLAHCRQRLYDGTIKVLKEYISYGNHIL